MSDFPATADLPPGPRERAEPTQQADPGQQADGGEEPTASGQAQEKLTVGQLLRVGAAAYLRQDADRGACPQVQSTLAKLSLCRTRALGGRTYQCDRCGQVSEVFHSCGDRHCPICSGRKRYDFAQRAEQLILGSVTYFQVVFTLPAELSGLALANRMSTCAQTVPVICA